MGKVFSYEEIHDRAIPGVDDFNRAKKVAVDQLSKVAREGALRGAKVFGSVAKGTPSERSDFDLIVVTKDDVIIPSLQLLFDEIYKDTNVPIEPIVLNEWQAQRGFHTIDPLFLDHIRNVDNESNLVGLDPSVIIEPTDFSVEKIHEQYLAQKIRRLKEGLFTYSDADRYRVMQRALEAPINVGRRTMQVLNGHGYDSDLSDDSKPSVIRGFRNVFNGTSLVEGFDFLLEKDWEYTAILRQAIDENVSREEYEQSVGQLVRKVIPPALTWTSELSRFYLNIIEGKPTYLEGQMHGRGERLL